MMQKEEKLLKMNRREKAGLSFEKLTTMMLRRSRMNGKKRAGPFKEMKITTK